MTEKPDWIAEAERDWAGLSGAARDTLICLCRKGPTWDGDVPSKGGRDELLDKKMAAKIVIKNNEQGYQAATYKGSRAYKYGFREKRRETIAKLTGVPDVKVRP